MIALIGTFAGLYLFAKLIYAFSVWASARTFPRLPVTKKVSVLVAARNEEEKIAACLASLAAQDFPSGKFEVIIGDDNSGDRTAEIVQSFCSRHAHFRYVKISESLRGLKGKQNVLAQLARQAEGELLAVTDADMVLPSQWLSEMYSACERVQGMVSGPTLVAGENIFAKVQQLDWMMGMGILKAHDTLRIPITAVGNNMIFPKRAYDSAGGYEAIPFSITEDYKLFQVLCEKGGLSHHQLYTPDALASTSPQLSFGALLRQRKRWFRGGGEIAVYNKALILFNATVVPVLIAGFFLIPFHWAMSFWLLKVFADLFFLTLNAVILGQGRSLLFFPLYELYYQLMAIVIPINQAWPGKVNWKGREY